MPKVSGIVKIFIVQCTIYLKRLKRIESRRFRGRQGANVPLDYRPLLAPKWGGWGHHKKRRSLGGIDQS
jgi:hypothetical protein